MGAAPPPPPRVMESDMHWPDGRDMLGTGREWWAPHGRPQECPRPPGQDPTVFPEFLEG